MNKRISDALSASVIALEKAGKKVRILTEKGKISFKINRLQATLAEVAGILGSKVYIAIVENKQDSFDVKEQEIVELLEKMERIDKEIDSLEEEARAL